MHNGWISCSLHVHTLKRLASTHMTHAGVRECASYHVRTAAGNVSCFYLKSIVDRGWPHICRVSYNTYVVWCCCGSVCCHRVVCVPSIRPHDVLWCCPLVHCYSCTAAQLLLMFMLHIAKMGIKMGKHIAVCTYSSKQKPAKIFRT